MKTVLPFIDECIQCGAPSGERIIRRLDDQSNWTGEVIRGWQEDGWGQPHTVRIVQKAGKCEHCYLSTRSKEQYHVTGIQPT